MAVYTNWYVTVILEVAGKERPVRGPSHRTEEAAQADLAAPQEKLGSGEWINLVWVSANPAHVVAAHVDSSSVGVF